MRKIAAMLLVSTFTLTGLAVAAEKEGMIQTINPMTKEITLDDGSKLAWDGNTQIMVEGKPGRLEQLKQGERVKVSFDEKNGKAVAKSVEVNK
jgi:Cu/Ag efflux protein CusF